MIETIEIINELAISDIFSGLLSAIIPLLILVITLRFEKKQTKQQLDQEKKEHQEILHLQNESNRIAAMPYFIISTRSCAHVESDKVYFNIFLINKGNGIAIKVNGKYIGLIYENCLFPLCETNLAVYNCTSIFDDKIKVVRPEEEYQLIIRQFIKNKSTDILSLSDFYCDEISFSVCFSDMYFNQYEQEFSFFIYKLEENRISLSGFSVKNPILINN